VRRFLPPRLVALFGDDRRRTVAESLCVLYVAMTRAAHCLHMIVAPPKANEKNLPKTYAGLLRATLGNGLASTAGVVYERGDEHWFERLERPAASAVPLAEEPPIAIRLAPPLPSRERGLERTSPSALEGGHKVSAARLLEAASEAAFEHGTLVHAWMEQLKWLDDGLPDDAALLAVAARAALSLAGDRSQLTSRLATFRQQLAAPQIAAALCRAAYDKFASHGELQLEVHTERNFAVRIGDELLSGSIDRLVLVRCAGAVIAAEVLDYKTDTIAAGDKQALADKVEFYRPQIEAYRQAVAKLFRLEPRAISARLVFLQTGKVCPID
jgi:ATP-dependent exoDNAse (exonuclease V) beta subunit